MYLGILYIKRVEKCPLEKILCHIMPEEKRTREGERTRRQEGARASESQRDTERPRRWEEEAIWQWDGRNYRRVDG